MTFSGIFKAEFKKLIRSKSIIIVSIIIIVVLLITSITFNLLGSISGNTDVGGAVDYQAAYAQLSDEFNSYKAGVEAGWQKKDYSYEIKAKQLLSYYTYVIENGAENVQLYSAQTQFTMHKNYSGFLINSWTVILQILLIAMAVWAAAILAGEIKNGTIKYLLISPTGRNTVFSAKMLVVMTVGAALGFAVLLLTAVAGLFATELYSPDYIVFWHTSAIRISPYTLLFIKLLSGLFVMFFVINMVFAIGNIYNSETIALLIPLLILFIGDILSPILSLAWLSSIDVSQNLFYDNMFMYGVVPGNGSNVYTMIAANLVFLTGFLAVNYTMFKRKDI